MYLYPNERTDRGKLISPYASKRSLQRFVSDVPECSNSSNDASVSTMKTRSKTLPQINWDYCIFCRQKAIKKDRKLKRIENSERVKYILKANIMFRLIFNCRVIISSMFFYPLQQIICNACRMILHFFLDIVNGQEAQQIIIKLTSCGF
jgi:hypothetical protein